MTFGTDEEEPRPDTGDEDSPSAPSGDTTDAERAPQTSADVPPGAAPEAAPPPPPPPPPATPPEPALPFPDPTPTPAPEPPATQAAPPTPQPEPMPPRPEPVPPMPQPEPLPPTPEPLPPRPEPQPAPPQPEPVPEPAPPVPAPEPVPPPPAPAPSFTPGEPEPRRPMRAESEDGSERERASEGLRGEPPLVPPPSPPRAIFEPPPLPVTETATAPAPAPTAEPPVVEAPLPSPEPALPSYASSVETAPPPVVEQPPPAAPQPPPITEQVPPAPTMPPPPVAEPTPPPPAPTMPPPPVAAPTPPAATPTVEPAKVPETPTDLFQGFTVIVADDPDAWAAQVAERVGARVISSAFTAEQVLIHRAEVAEQRKTRERLKEAERLTGALEALPGGATQSPAPATTYPSAGIPTMSPAPGGADLGTRSAIDRVRHLATAIADARRLEESARARLDQGMSQTDAARRLQSSLETAPDQLRAASATALQAAERVRTIKEALGERPNYDPETHERVLEANDDAEDAVDHYEFLRRRVPALLAVALGLALVAVSQRLETVYLAIVIGVLLVAVAFMFRRLFTIRSKRGSAKQALANSLASAGVERTDQLEQRKIELEAWERRSTEAQAADAAWAEASREWQSLAGPEAQPDQVETVIDDLQRAQQITERLSTDRTAHLVAGQDVVRREDEWSRLMRELGLDVPSTDAQRAIDQLSARLSPEEAPVPAATPTPQTTGLTVAEPSSEERTRLEAELARALEGFTLAELRFAVQRLGPEHPSDERPLLLADPTRGLPTHRKRTLLSEFERLSKMSPVVLVTTDPEVQAWAASR